MDSEQQLEGGNASGAVIKFGDTVRKAWAKSTPSIHAYMRSLRDSGVDVPAVFGRDENGRQILEYVPGELAMNLAPFTPLEFERVGALVRLIHDASSQFAPADGMIWTTAIPAPGDDLVCHNDLAPWNLICGERWVFIDWDAAAPSTRLWDLACSAQAFTLGNPEADPARAAADLAAFVNGYNADDELRAALPSVMGERAAAMLDLLATSYSTGHEPWATMFTSGHGDHWRAVAEYVKSREDTWRAAL